jgi:hypothetical protein
MAGRLGDAGDYAVTATSPANEPRRRQNATKDRAVAT